VLALIQMLPRVKKMGAVEGELNDRVPQLEDVFGFRITSVEGFLLRGTVRGYRNLG
jgi:hypothetical protein